MLLGQRDFLCGRAAGEDLLIEFCYRGFVVGLGGEEETVAFPRGRLQTHGVQQRTGDASPKVVRVAHDVLDVDVVWLVLAAEGDTMPTTYP